MSPTTLAGTRDVVVVGASTGGIDALPKLVGQLPASLPASVVIVQHRAANASVFFIDLVRRDAHMPVHWVEQGERHERGHIYLAPPDLHATFSDGHFNLTATARENHARPSINRLFRSAAAQYGSRTVGVILTGLLDDGVAGLVAIARVGGETVVQDPESAVARDLPRNAIAAVPESRVVPLDEIGQVLVETTRTPPPTTRIPDELRLEADMDTRTSRPEELDRLGRPARLSCSECGGPLWRMEDGGPLRYRCYLGHAMSADQRLQRYDDEVEVALWNAVRALDERATTLESLAIEARRCADETAATIFERRSRDAREQARMGYEFMQDLTSQRR